MFLGSDLGFRGFRYTGCCASRSLVGGFGSGLDQVGGRAVPGVSWFATRVAAFRGGGWRLGGGGSVDAEAECVGLSASVFDEFDDAVGVELAERFDSAMWVRDGDDVG